MLTAIGHLLPLLSSFTVHQPNSWTARPMASRWTLGSPKNA